jgi:hypothetical protein
VLRRTLGWLPILTAIFLFCFISRQAVAAGVVSTCDESHLTDALKGGGLVTFSGDCTITVISTKTITVNTTIDGSGHKVVLDGGGNVTVLRVDSAESPVLSVNHLIIQHANGDTGGGIYVRNGTAIVTNSTFLQNRSTYGGAITSSGGTLYVDNSTFDSNSASLGGAITIAGPGSISNSTFYNNTATGPSGLGGALNVDIPPSVDVLVTNNTFVNNHSPLRAGGVYVNGGTATLKNNILVKNSSSCSSDGHLVDGGYNLDDDGSCGFTATGSKSNDRNITFTSSAPQNNTGPTATLALAATDADAIGVIPPGTNGCATTLIADQRGVARPGSLNGACSMGAYEYVPPTDHLITDCSNDSQFHDAFVAGGRITFTCGSDPKTIPLTHFYGNSTTNTVIDGNGSRITLSLSDTQLTSGAVLTINDLTLTDATGGALAAISGTLIVTNSTLSNNRGDGPGNAITNDEGTVIASNTTIAQNAGVDENYPGAVFDVRGTVIFTNCTIANNSSPNGNGAIGGDTFILQNDCWQFGRKLS